MATRPSTRQKSIRIPADTMAHVKVIAALMQVNESAVIADCVERGIVLVLDELERRRATSQRLVTLAHVPTDRKGTS